MFQATKTSKSSSRKFETFCVRSAPRSASCPSLTPPVYLTAWRTLTRTPRSLITGRKPNLCLLPTLRRFNCAHSVPHCTRWIRWSAISMMNRGDRTPMWIPSTNLNETTPNGRLYENEYTQTWTQIEIC